LFDFQTVHNNQRVYGRLTRDLVGNVSRLLVGRSVFHPVYTTRDDDTVVRSNCDTDVVATRRLFRTVPVSDERLCETSYKFVYRPERVFVVDYCHACVRACVRSSGRETGPS